MEITPGIHHFPTEPFNWYVLAEGGRLTVVDAGFPGHFGTLLRGLRTIGRELQDIEAVIITHAHADHMGFATRIQNHTGASVFVHEADLGAARRRWQLPWSGLLASAWRPFMASTLTRATLHGVFWGPGIARAHGIRDGQVLNVPGRPRVIHVPGHTPGQIALHLPERRVLLSSDVLITRDLLTGVDTDPQVPHPSLNDDTRLARRSLGALGDMGAVTLLPGHGRPWRGVMADAVRCAADIAGKR